MFDLATDSEMTGLLETLAEVKLEARLKLMRVAELVGVETVKYLKSYTAGLQPPETPGGSPRPKHVGGWSDITRSLVDAYGYRVKDLEDLILLSVFNADDEAIFVELMEGYFVLHGVMDPGGPVDLALRRAVAEVAPDWIVRG